MAAIGDRDRNGTMDLAVGDRYDNVWLLFLAHDSMVRAHRQIRAGMGGVPITYRFAVQTGEKRYVVLGFCESHWAEAGQRPLVINVEVPVRVFDGGRFVRDLTIKDFEVYEDGEEQKIEAVYLISDRSMPVELDAGQIEKTNKKKEKRPRRKKRR